MGHKLSMGVSDVLNFFAYFTLFRAADMSLELICNHGREMLILTMSRPYHLQAPGRPRLASSSKDATVRIWDVVTKRIETVLSGHKGSVSCK